MKIWIDGYEANVSQRLGSSQVAFEFLKGFEKLDCKNDYTIFLPTPPLLGLPKEREGWRYKILKPKKLWTRIALPLALYTAKQKPEIFFSPSHYIPRFSPVSVKKIATIFDLSFLRFPRMFIKRDLWKLKNWTKFSAANAECLITISNFSRKDICKEYGLSKDKVIVAYPGYDRTMYNVHCTVDNLKQIRSKYKIGESYIIYIGTIQPRKNLIRLMEGFAKVSRDISNLELIIVGKTTGLGRQGWMYEDILQAPHELGIAEKVKFLGFVPIENLTALLSGALAFIQPSLYEGFGIPVLEAMAAGVPVIVSNVSSLPEIAGKAGLLVDPYSIDQIEQAIRTMATDKKLRQKYVKAGIARAKEFSWDKMAKTVLKVFESI